MKILHINASYKPAFIYGGPTMSVSQLCEKLVKAGTSVEVFTTTANGSQELQVTPNVPTTVDGITVTYFKRTTKDHTHFSPSLLKALRNRVNEFDVVHIHAWWNLVSVLAALIAIKKEVPVVLSPRGMLSAYSFINRNNLKKKLIHLALGKKLLYKCHIHATAQSEARAVKAAVKPLSVSVIPNFVKLPDSRPVKDNNDDLNPLKLVFFSRIEEKKGLDILLRALPRLNFPFTLTIAGAGEPEYITMLKALITHDNIAAKINWLGFIGDDKFDLLSNHHLLILPSHDENFGNVVIESLSVGTPVLISNAVGLANYVSDNKLGWVCEANEADLSHTLNQIQADLNAQLNRIKKTAPQLIRDDFNEDNLIKQYTNLYKTLIK